MERVRPVAMLAALGFVLLLPYIGVNRYWMQQLILISILSLIVSGLNTSLGYGGELAVGQVALYAVGAYMAGGVANRHGHQHQLSWLAAANAAPMIIAFFCRLTRLR